MNYVASLNWIMRWSSWADHVQAVIWITRVRMAKRGRGLSEGGNISYQCPKMGLNFSSSRSEAIVWGQEEWGLVLKEVRSQIIKTINHIKNFRLYNKYDDVSVGLRCLGEVSSGHKSFVAISYSNIIFYEHHNTERLRSSRKKCLLLGLWFNEAWSCRMTILDWPSFLQSICLILWTNVCLLQSLRSDFLNLVPEIKTNTNVALLKSDTSLVLCKPLVSFIHKTLTEIWYFSQWKNKIPPFLDLYLNGETGHKYIKH